jgi:hypothetical protein
MKFKPVYKCQRCGLIYVDDDIRDSDDDENFNAIQKHHCGQAEYGAADIIGYNLMDEAAKTQSHGRFGRIAQLLQRLSVDEAVSELRRWQREEDENYRWFPASDAQKDSNGNIIPIVYYGYTSGPCSASGLIRYNGTKWEWITHRFTCHREMGEGQSLMLCPIPEAPDIPR